MRTETKLNELKDSPAYQLWLASNAWLRLVRRALEPLQITHAQYVILASTERLATDGHRATQAEICRFAALDENMTSQVVKVLSDKGLIERFQHPDDRRAYALRLTEEGRELTQRAKDAVKPASQRFFARLGDDLSSLTRLLHALNEREDGA